MPWHAQIAIAGNSFKSQPRSPLPELDLLWSPWFPAYAGPKSEPSRWSQNPRPLMAGAWALDAWNSRLGPSREGKGAGGLLLWPVSIFGNAKPMVYLHVIIYSCYSYFMESYAPMYRMVDWCCWMLIVDVFFQVIFQSMTAQATLIHWPPGSSARNAREGLSDFFFVGGPGHRGKDWEIMGISSMFIDVYPCVIIFSGVKIPANTISRYL